MQEKLTDLPKLHEMQKDNRVTCNSANERNLRKMGTLKGKIKVPNHFSHAFQNEVEYMFTK